MHLLPRSPQKSHLLLLQVVLFGFDFLQKLEEDFFDTFPTYSIFPPPFPNEDGFLAPHTPFLFSPFHVAISDLLFGSH